MAKIEQYRIISLEEYCELKHTARMYKRGIKAVNKERGMFILRSIALVIMLIAIITSIIGACYITYTGYASGKEFSDVMIHAMMEMIICVVPAGLICKEICEYTPIYEENDSETESEIEYLSDEGFDE